ncbi:hypothetical protein GGS23DRAFT_592995 [Durotheca rogersii]|uniref:uncharacterized protein n=1 Tax=Durotheca rogersii TaxID=419775 RepID=UPI00221FFF5B|nr:uncharacterized protein GGS23DRAFT_592995 [Durotheca rogersii]KAI5867709.1 hypothetical protein GGS23DRAFT_592995 [Durotheca rogersii]
MAAAGPVLPGSSPSNQQAPGSTAPVFEFVCLFTRDLRRKQKRWQDGRLKYHAFNRRVMVYDDRGNFVGDTHWHEDYDFGEGDELELERGGVVVQVAECTGSRDQDLSELVDKRAKEKAERQLAAIARRAPALEIAAPHANAPHFQLRHKPLHQLIGTPTGHHGRASIPTESPYEERQKPAESPRNNSVHPAKRRRRDVSPPSKNGYAQSLFGATLTLSGTPSSTPSVRKIPLGRESSTPAESQAPESPDPSRCNDGADSTPRVAPRTTLDSPARPQTFAPRTAPSNPRLFPTASAKSAPGIETGSPPTIRRIAHDVRRNPTTGSTRPKKQEEEKQIRAIENASKRVVSASLSPRLPEAEETINGSIPVGKCKPLNDASPEVASKQRGANQPQFAVGTDALLQNRDLLSGFKPKSTTRELGVGTERENPFLGEHPHEPRTELRIRPRKKRGLLMISENSNADSLSKPQTTESRMDDRNQSTRRSTDSGDSHRTSDIPSILIGNYRNGKSQRDLPEEMEAHDGSYEVNNGQALGPTLRQKNAVQVGTTRSSRKTKDAEPGKPEGDEFSFPNDTPAPPRLANLGRKGIRSKEIIGFIFEEETESPSAPQPKTHGNESDGPSPARDSPPIGPFSAKPPAPESDLANVTIVNSVLDAKKGPYQDRATAMAKAELHDSSASRLVENHGNMTVSHIEEYTSRAQKQIGAASVKVIAVEDMQAEVPQSASVTQRQQPPPAVKPIANPATRGKKAAKPSDSAGQVPQCPLPPESTTGTVVPPRTRGDNRAVARPGGRANQSAIAPLTGFKRANGGPWSREAHDLFEFTRPPKNVCG